MSGWNSRSINDGPWTEPTSSRWVRPNMGSRTTRPVAGHPASVSSARTEPVRMNRPGRGTSSMARLTAPRILGCHLPFVDKQGFVLSCYRRVRVEADGGGLGWAVEADAGAREASCGRGLATCTRAYQEHSRQVRECLPSDAIDQPGDVPGLFHVRHDTTLRHPLIPLSVTCRYHSSTPSTIAFRQHPGEPGPRPDRGPARQCYLDKFGSWD